MKKVTLSILLAVALFTVPNVTSAAADSPVVVNGNLPHQH